ncbi:hypothetical protein [Pseudonocardia sp. MH-G8]|uniref:hypothetical protein n=1 Tax=Pseudonocardia sp. MH-G8 TaxID=1854588 RepID=UPI001179BFD6|nr:hypothetical protein [Pseudonocardia sp. MH-G8]
MSRPRERPASSQLGDACTISVTCVADGRSHAVPDGELAMAATQRGGYYSAVCGHLVTPAPMVAPDGELCRACAERDAAHRRRRSARGYRF